MNVRLRESKLESKPLDANAFPETAQALASTIEELGRALDILPQASDDTMSKQVKARNLGYRKWTCLFKPEANTLPGRFPASNMWRRHAERPVSARSLSREEIGAIRPIWCPLETILKTPLGGQYDVFSAMSG
ncbi:hypothetical protein B0T10DRAFT_461445 [Thelonectria olida]|uniref:Uncharacterized protein n=1 Tax=Thelonectria olida TaxID=1576542 RepID=A0A9P8W0N1_9HYPO|nr:hypothetical protein B0T10DRAFT_461445 [Thelonectria olida]